MALISHVDLPAQKLVLYNVHLESRGNENLRCSQLGEILSDLRQYPADVQVVVAGDFNADLRHEPVAAAIGKTGLINPFAHISGRPTTIPSRSKRFPAIDWVLLKGPLIALEPKVHDSVGASDHYPLSLVLSQL